MKYAFYKLRTQACSMKNHLGEYMYMKFKLTQILMDGAQLVRAPILPAEYIMVCMVTLGFVEILQRLLSALKI
jgi:hypothetical protein